MNILVTGGAGFIGSNYVHLHLQQFPNDQVIVYDKLTYAGNLQNLEDLKTNPHYKFVKGDICNSKLFRETLKKFGINTIVNFAAESHVDRSITKPADFMQTNILGIFQILEATRDNPHIRLHHISTDEVFGSLPLDYPDLKFTEESPYNPQSPYSASKAAGDHLVRSYINTYQIKATISNCSNNFGPYCFPEKFIPLAITRALMDQEIPLYGDGMQVRDWIHVSDHCSGIDLVLQKGDSGETYLFGGNGEMNNIAVARQILNILDKSEDLIIHVGDRKGHDRRYAMDFSKAQVKLGFNPQKDFPKHLQDTVKWYQENKEWWLPLKPQADKIAEDFLKKRI